MNGGATTAIVSGAGSKQCPVPVEVITDIAGLAIGSSGRFETWAIAEDRKFSMCPPEELTRVAKIGN